MANKNSIAKKVILGLCALAGMFALDFRVANVQTNETIEIYAKDFINGLNVDLGEPNGEYNGVLWQIVNR